MEGGQWGPALGPSPSRCHRSTYVQPLPLLVQQSCASNDSPQPAPGLLATAWCHEDQSPGALWLPEPGQLSCFVSERTSGHLPQGKASRVSEPTACSGWSPPPGPPCGPGLVTGGPETTVRASAWASWLWTWPGRAGRGFCPSRPWSWLHPMPLERMTTVAEPPAHTFAGPCSLSLGTGQVPSQSAAVCRSGGGGHVPTPAGLSFGLLGGAWGWVLWTRRSVT